MNIEKLIITMCEIIGEKHHIKISAQIYDKGDFLQNEGVVRNERNDKNTESGGLYQSVNAGASTKWAQLKNAERRNRQVG